MVFIYEVMDQAKENIQVNFGYVKKVIYLYGISLMQDGNFNFTYLYMQQLII